MNCCTLTQEAGVLLKKPRWIWENIHFYRNSQLQMHFEHVEPRSPYFNRRYCLYLKGQVEGKATVHRALGQKEQKACEVKEKLLLPFPNLEMKLQGNFSKEVM